jgi:hypothetical protein
MRVQERIIKLIREQAYNRGIDTEILRVDTSIALKMMFQNRGKGSSLLLTKTGHEILSRFFDCYVIDMPSDFEVLPKHLVYLNHNMHLPYFIESRKISVYHPRDGVMLKMLDGDLNQLISMKKAVLCWNI